MFLRYLHFRPDFLVMQKSDLIRKLWLISIFLTSQTTQQISTIHVLSNTSISKSNQAMKFGQLIKYSVRDIFFKNYAENDVGKLVTFIQIYIFTIFLEDEQPTLN